MYSTSETGAGGDVRRDRECKDHHTTTDLEEMTNAGETNSEIMKAGQVGARHSIRPMEQVVHWRHSCFPATLRQLSEPLHEQAR
jgi:hypothetical protein